MVLDITPGDGKLVPDIAQGDGKTSHKNVWLATTQVSVTTGFAHTKNKIKQKIVPTWDEVCNPFPTYFILQN